MLVTLEFGQVELLETFSYKVPEGSLLRGLLPADSVHDHVGMPLSLTASEL